MKTILCIMLTTIFMTATAQVETIKQIGQVYVFESDGNGFNTNTVFYDDGKEVVAFDAQFTPELARQAIAFLRTKTKNPIRWLVVTHPNPDKFNGIPAFKEEGAKVIMSEETAKNLKGVHDYKKYYFVQIAKMFTDETYPKLPEADVTFKDQYDIKTSNGGLIELTELHLKGISTNQTVAHIESANALVVGDLVHFKTHAWLEGPIINGKTNYSTANWVVALQKIKSSYQPDLVIYGGRGPSEKISTVVNAQIQYLQQAEQITKDYVASLSGDIVTDKKKNVNYGDLTKVFESKFQGYALSYMIAYGAYGLVEAIH